MKANSAIVGIARAGYASKAVVYLTVGVLAAAAALDFGFGEVASAKESIDKFDDGTLAPVVLGLTGIGLVGYIVWKFVQVIWDPEEHNDSAPKALIRRIFYAVSGLAYTTVAFTAITSAVGLKSGDSGSGRSGTHKAVEWMFGLQYGQYLIMALGALIIGFGVYQAHKGYNDKYLENLRQFDMPGWLRRVVGIIGPIGHFGRATVFAVTGGLVVFAGIRVDSSEAGGSERAMQWLVSQPWGETMLFGVGVAFVCYGMFVATKARYREFDVA